MDEDFKIYLAQKGIAEKKYNSGSLDAQVKLMEMFRADKSKQGVMQAARLSPGTGVMQKPTCSASAITSKNQKLYDAFDHVAAESSFIPNVVLREIKCYVPPASDVTNFLSQFCPEYVDTFRAISCGNETVGSLQTAMAAMSKGRLKCEKWEPSCVYLANSASAEYTLYAQHPSVRDIAFCGAEERGVESSIRECFPQLMCVCGSSCMELYRLGVAREACVLPGVAMAGHSVQFLAVYLVADNFPVLVEVSPVLRVVDDRTHHWEFGQWAMRAVHLALRALDRVLELPQKRIAPRCNIPAERCVLNLQGYFTKPVRPTRKVRLFPETTAGISNMALRLNQLLSVYEAMRCVDHSHLILYPEGVVTVPGEDVLDSSTIRAALTERCKQCGFTLDYAYCPIVLFAYLDGWKTEKPLPELQGSYLEQLGAAVAVMNKAGVAHLDLRPDNVLWRSRAGGRKGVPLVEVKIIDFEDAVYFEFPIPTEYIRVIVHDARYPHEPGDERKVQLARAEHNKFFEVALTEWVNSDAVSFTDLMVQIGAQVWSSVRVGGGGGAAGDGDPNKVIATDEPNAAGSELGAGVSHLGKRHKEGGDDGGGAGID